MAVRAQCPRCKQPLSVPNKLAGSYANCPRCQGRFWVSKDAPIDPSVGDSVGISSAVTLTLAPAAIPPIAVSPPALASGGPAHASPGSASASGFSPPPTPSAVCPPSRQYFPSVTQQLPPVRIPAPQPPIDAATAPGGSPVAPPQARKVARLVSADPAQSPLKLAADGQLPHLQLQEDDNKHKNKGKSRSIPPLAIVGAWVMSVVVTAAIVMMPGNDNGPNSITQAKREAMSKLEEQFYGNPARGELLPYQKLLREARQARARGDLKAEQQYYKQVLDLLHTETWGGSSASAARNRLEKGVTGSRIHDRELEKLILTVMVD